MAALKLTVAEATAIAGGETRYVLEYHREGQGVQRPTFVFDKDVPFEEAAVEMRKQIEEQEKLNRRPSAGKSTEKLKKLVGQEI